MLTCTPDAIVTTKEGALGNDDSVKEETGENNRRREQKTNDYGPCGSGQLMCDG